MWDQLRYGQLDKDEERWACDGNRGWEWDSVLPDNIKSYGWGNSLWQGNCGKVTVSNIVLRNVDG